MTMKTMKRFIIAAIISAGFIADALACAPEAPTHNAYMFSVYRREKMKSPFAEDMNNWWKAYADDPASRDNEYYKQHADTLRAIARRRGDKHMLEYMKWLDEYLRISDGISMDSWDYPTKMELAARDELGQDAGHGRERHAGDRAVDDGEHHQHPGTHASWTSGTTFTLQIGGDIVRRLMLKNGTDQRIVIPHLERRGGDHDIR